METIWGAEHKPKYKCEREEYDFQRLRKNLSNRGRDVEERPFQGRVSGLKLMRASAPVVAFQPMADVLPNPFQSYRTGSSNIPGIDQGNRRVREVGRVARGQRGVMGQRDTRDHGVAQVAGTPLLLTGCHQIASVLGGSGIEGDDAMSDLGE